MMNPARTRRRAFSLLELLTVAGVIAVLVSMLVVGGLKMINTGKVSSTRVTLNVMQNMLSEFDAKTRLSSGPQFWLWSENGTSLTYEPSGAVAELNFWRVPFKTVGTPPQYDSLIAPTEVENDTPGDRNASIAVYNTAVLMPLLTGLPSNRAAIEKMAADRLFTPQYMPTSPADNSGKVRMPGTDRVLMTTDDSAGQGPMYFQGAIVEYNKKRYRAIADPGSALPTDNTKWLELPSATPMLLDAWNNPIIFVPGSGLRVRLLKGEKAYMQNPTTPYNASNLGITIVVSPEGQVDTSVLNAPFCKKPGRPFFASAGPDGNFATGDDNLYSFETQ